MLEAVKGFQLHKTPRFFSIFLMVVYFYERRLITFPLNANENRLVGLNAGGVHVSLQRRHDTTGMMASHGRSNCAHAY